MARRALPRLLPAVLWRTLPVATVLLVGLMLLAHSYIRTTLENEITERVKREGEAAMEAIDARLESLLSILETMAANDIVINALVDDGARRQSTVPFVQSLSVSTLPEALVGFVDYRGRLLASNQDDPLVFPGKWIDEVMAGRSHAGIDPLEVTMAVPVNFAGRPEGAIFIRFPVAFLIDFLDRPHTAEAVTLSFEGEVLAARGTTLGARWTPASSDGGWLSSTAASRKLPGLTMVLGSRTELIFSQLYGLNRFLGSVALVSLALLTAGLVLTALLVARPLKRLNAELAQVEGAGDLQHRLSRQGYEEVASVADGFNTMLERLGRAVVSNEALLEENTQRLYAEQRILEQKAEMETLFETVEDGILVIDSGGRIISGNTAVFGVFGYEREELLDRDVSILVPEPHRSMHHSYLAGHTRREGATVVGRNRELNAVRKDGSLFPMELLVSEMRVKGEKRFVGVIRDITERHKVDQMKREFISIVSHELRTPLTSLIGSLGLVKSGSFGDLSDKAKHLLGLAQSNADRLIALVNDILDVEKLEAGREELRFEAVDLLNLVRDCAEQMSAYGTKHQVDFMVRTDVQSAYVSADPQRLAQVLANLLSNAAKFSTPGTSVVVSVEESESRLRLSVEDTGNGVPDEEVEKIFGKFYQIDSSDTRNQQGTGLGLPIAQAIVRAHGSEITVARGRAGGAIFAFELTPCACAVAPGRTFAEVERAIA